MDYSSEMSSHKIMEKSIYHHLTSNETSKYKSMEKKKSNRTNLENKRVIFLEFGFILSLTSLLVAFEWQSPESSMINLHSGISNEIEELLPVNTVQPKPLPPTPPKICHKITIVETNDPVPSDFIPFDVSASDDTPVPDYIPALPEDKPAPGEDTIFLVVEKMPEFPGGEAELYRFLRENVSYPRAAKEACISGVVYVGFVVEKDGSLSSFEVKRSPHPLLSKESLRVLSMMPAWNPGNQRGKAVRVSFGLPIRFTLQ
jgi:protein TonB